MYCNEFDTPRVIEYNKPSNPKGQINGKSVYPTKR